MSHEFQSQFFELRKKALAELRPFPEVSGQRDLFTLVELPSFKASASWTVCAATKAEQKFTVHTKTWRSDVDLRIFESPLERLRHPKDLLPTVQEEVCEIPASEISRHEAALAGLRFAPYLAMPTSMYCDGTSYEFLSDVLFSSCRLTWHEDGPEEWRSEVAVLRRILEDLKKKKPNQSTTAQPASREADR
jgi:hypothetical protein